MKKPWFEVERYIGGEFFGGGDAFEVRYPATNEVIGSAPEGKEPEVDAAVSAAREGGVYSREFFTEAKTVCLSNK